MLKKILVIEDEAVDFYKIKRFLVDSGYTVLPDNFEEMAKAFDPYSSGDILDFVIHQIEENYKDLGLVLTDIKLGEDDSGGNKVVKMLRNYIDTKFSNLSKIPIIAISHYPSRQQSILHDGADSFINKEHINDDRNAINIIINTHIDIFEKNLKQRDENENKTIRSLVKGSQKVFIVHGHAEAEEKVARFLEHLGLSPIILHEQPNDGYTIIEKIEKYSNVGFAIVLYTSCDEGKDKEEDRLKPRARQNVVFEHGYMTAKLGRENVCVLQEPGVELPGDISGLVYVPLDDSGAWKIQLAKNLKKRGFDIDMNKVY